MCCENDERTVNTTCGSGYVIILVLYILLAIILGSWLAW